MSGRDKRPTYKPGDPVWYFPIIGGSIRFAGVVEDEPVKLGSHTWVVNVCELEPEYAAKHPGRGTRAVAVCMPALRRRGTALEQAAAHTQEGGGS
jgi:hypothetical protein